MIDRTFLIAEEIDILLAERRDIGARGPCINIIHSGLQADYGCLLGHRILLIQFVYRSREYNIRVSPTEAVVFDFLARHQRLPRTASQIAFAIKEDVIYRTYVRDRSSDCRKIRPRRATVKVHLHRITAALDAAFASAHAPFNGTSVLVGRRVGNQIQYQLQARIELSHVRTG